jgi:hypothetical protein
VATLARLYDFQPMTPIVSAEVDQEFNQLVNALNGTSTGINLATRFNSSTVSVLKLDQLGSGPIQEWAQSGVTVATLTNSGGLALTAGATFGGALNTTGVVATGNIQTSARLISSVATGTAPLGVSSTTLVTNLNADMLDGMHASEFNRGGLYDFSVNQTQTSGTSPTTLMTGVITGNTMTQSGDILVYEIAGRLFNDDGSNANITFSVVLDGNTLHTEVQNTNAANQHYICRITIIRTGSTSANVTIDWNFSRYGQVISDNGGSFTHNDQFSKVQMIPGVSVTNWTENRDLEFVVSTSSATVPVLRDQYFAVMHRLPVV